MVEELTQAEDAFAACADAATWALPEDELIAALDTAHRVEQRLAAVKLALIRELDGRSTAVAQGASSTAVWLRERLRLTIPAARRLVDLAAPLKTGNPGVRHALADGHVTVDQARIIVDAVDTVQTAAGPDAAAKAALDAEAHRATRDRHLTFSTLTDGRLRLAGILDTETAGLLRAAIDLLPAVLNSTGQPLDLGRQRRLITGPLRRALVLRDRGCAFPGCDRPPRWCDAHHIHHWADGGTTSLATPSCSAATTTGTCTTATGPCGWRATALRPLSYCGRWTG
ncbi:DUF222 domain-containing protein [Micromonospora sp. NPDC049175]|uniref:HNH endonuclease signature motif containing protein n=1 Tax=Micromonospora sp. NPDC049175 TaxID=3364266 RepID=UPI0037185F50